MDGKVTYHQQVSYCGKPQCRKCREGIGHGPYWYAYKTVNGQTTRTYIGKHLPPEAYEAYDSPITTEVEVAPLAADYTITAPSNYQRETPAPDVAAVRISALGQFRLERATGSSWQQVTDAAWRQPRTRMLLAYLVSQPDRRASRQQLFAALWPGETKQDAFTSAAQSLRRILEPTRKGKVYHLLQYENDALTLADQRHIWLDSDAFLALLKQVYEGNDPQKQEGLLEEALSLSGGDFLPEERRASWALERRQELRRQWGRAVLLLTDLRIRRDAFAETIDWLDRLLAIEPGNEGAIQRLMVALARLKRRGEALRAFQQFMKALRVDLQSEPSADTMRIYEMVVQGDIDDINPDLLPSMELATPEEPTAVSKAPDEVQGVEGRHVMAADESGQGRAATVKENGAPVELSPIGRAHQSPLVGRERELEMLRAVLRQTEQSTMLVKGRKRGYSALPLDTQRVPQFVLLQGEAGIGKTRLAEEMSREAHSRGWTVIWSRAYSSEMGIPYRIWIEVLRKVLGLSGTVSYVSGQAAQSGGPPVLREALSPLEALLPELQQFSSPSSSSVLALREQEQLRIWEAVHALLTGASESTPLLIVLDDIQWADGSSYELLGYLARHLQHSAIVFVATCRHNELTERSRHPLRQLIEHMQRERSVAIVTVEPLTAEEIAALVSYVPHLSEPLIRHIQNNAAGNPFFAEELARSTPPTLPENIAAALDHRMKRLSPECQQMLWNAAVLGGSFELNVICAMEGDRARMDEDIVLERLEEALQAGVITEEGTGTHISYHFWHPLLVSHLYDSLSAARRIRLHRRAADILLQLYRGREEEIAAMITHHLVQSSAEAERIAYYATLAGDYAYALSAYAEAERHYRTAVEQINRVRTQDRPMAAAEGRHAFPVEISATTLERLAECMMILGQFDEAARTYDRLLAMRAMQGAQYAAEPGLNSPYEAQIQALIWGEIGQARRNLGDNEQAKQCFTRGESVLRAAGVEAGPAWGRLRYLQGMLYWQEGRYEQAKVAAQEAIALFSDANTGYEQVNAPSRTRPLRAGKRQTTRTQRTLEGDPINLGRTQRLLGAIAYDLGRRDEALKHLNSALAIYEQYDHKREIAHVSCNLGHIHLKRGGYELAHSTLRRSLDLAEQIGDVPLISVIYSNLAELAASLGDLQEAETRYRRSLSMAERFHDLRYVSAWNVGLAAVLQEQGKLDDAAKSIRRAWLLARTMRNIPSLGAALVALASLRLEQARSTEKLPHVRARLLAHARRDVERALAFAALEAETRAQGDAVLADILAMNANVTSI